MMGRKKTPQPKLFYEKISLDKRIRKDHILRNIDQVINFDFIYKEVEHLYGTNGNVSVPPPVILKMMLLLILSQIERFRLETTIFHRGEGHKHKMIYPKVNRLCCKTVFK